MKVALIKGRREFTGASGVDYFLQSLFTRLKKKHEVKMIYGNYLLPEPFKLLPLRRLNSFDIIHAGAPELAAFIFSTKPILGTFYDDAMCHPEIYLKWATNFQQRFKISLNKLILKNLIKLGLKKCALVVAISEEAKKGVIKSFGIAPEKVTCIPPGVNTDIFKPQESKKPGKKLKLFFCGKIGYRKGVDKLLQAISILKRSISVELWLAGELHPFFNLNKILDRDDLRDNVRCFGYVSEAKLIKLYNEADIFVFPSTEEGYGIPPLEALSSGTKVVCSKMPSIEPFKEFITLTGINPQSIANNILKSIDKEVDFKLAREKIKKGYSTKIVAERYIRLYKALIKK